MRTLLCLTIFTVCIPLNTDVAQAQSMEYIITGVWNSGAERTALSAPNTSFSATFTLPTPVRPNFSASDRFQVSDVPVIYQLGEKTINFRTTVEMLSGNSKLIGFSTNAQFNLHTSAELYTGPSSSPTLVEGTFPSIGGDMNNAGVVSLFTGQIEARTPTRKRSLSTPAPGLYKAVFHLTDWRLELNVRIEKASDTQATKASFVIYATDHTMVEPIIFKAPSSDADVGQFDNLSFTTTSNFPPIQLSVKFVLPNKIDVTDARWGDPRCQPRPRSELKRRSIEDCRSLHTPSIRPATKAFGYYRGSEVGGVTPHIFVSPPLADAVSIKFVTQDSIQTDVITFLPIISQQTFSGRAGSFNYSGTFLDNGAIRLRWTPPGSPEITQLLVVQHPVLKEGQLEMPVVEFTDRSGSRRSVVAVVSFENGVLKVEYRGIPDMSFVVSGQPDNGIVSLTSDARTTRDPLLELIVAIGAAFDDSGKFVLFTRFHEFSGLPSPLPSEALTTGTLLPFDSALGQGNADFKDIECSDLTANIRTAIVGDGGKPSTRARVQVAIDWSSTTTPVSQVKEGNTLVGTVNSGSCGQVDWELRFLRVGTRSRPTTRPVLWIHRPGKMPQKILIHRAASEKTFCVSGVSFTGNEKLNLQIITPSVTIATDADGSRKAAVTYNFSDRVSRTSSTTMFCSVSNVTVNDGQFEATATGPCGRVSFRGVIGDELRLTNQVWIRPDSSSINLTDARGAPFAPADTSLDSLFVVSNRLRVSSNLQQARVIPVGMLHPDIARDTGRAVTLSLVYIDDNTGAQMKVNSVTLPLLNSAFATSLRGDFDLVRGCISTEGLHLWADVQNGIKATDNDSFTLRLDQSVPPALPSEGEYLLSNIYDFADRTGSQKVFPPRFNSDITLTVSRESKDVTLAYSDSLVNATVKKALPAGSDDLPSFSGSVTLGDRILTSHGIFIDLESTGRADFPLVTHAESRLNRTGVFTKPAVGGYVVVAPRIRPDKSISVDITRWNTRTDANAVIDEIQAIAGPNGAFLDVPLTLGSIPTDPCYEDQAKQCGGTLKKFYVAAGLVRDSGENVWDSDSVKGTNIQFGVIDSGVNIREQDLKQEKITRLINPPQHLPLGNFFTVTGELSEKAEDTDLHGHGTGMAGLIVGQHNTLNVAGVAPEASLEMAYAGVPVSSARILNALKEFQLNRPNLNIINMSMGSTRDPHVATEEYLFWFSLIVQSLTEKGVPVFVGSGNENGSHPATDGSGTVAPEAQVPGVIAIGAWYPPRQQLVDYSGWSWFGTDLVAPSGNNNDDHVAVLSVRGGVKGSSGTSLSTAIAAGIAALALEAHPKLIVGTNSSGNRRCRSFDDKDPTPVRCLQKLIAILQRSSNNRIVNNPVDNDKPFAPSIKWIPLDGLKAINANISDPPYEPLPRAEGVQTTGCNPATNCRITVTWSAPTPVPALYELLGYVVTVDGLVGSGFRDPTQLRLDRSFMFAPRADVIHGKVLPSVIHVQVSAAYKGKTGVDTADGDTFYRSLGSGLLIECDTNGCRAMP